MTDKISPYIRNGIYPVEQILPLLKAKTKGKGKEYIELDGVQVKISSQRYEIFLVSLKCYQCGLEGKFFAAEKIKADKSEKYHFNLYAINSDGDEVLMTRDHIVPLSKGGKNIVSNQKTMCTDCNSNKRNKMTLLSYVFLLKEWYNTVTSFLKCWR